MHIYWCRWKKDRPNIYIPSVESACVNDTQIYIPLELVTCHMSVQKCVTVTVPTVEKEVLVDSVWSQNVPWRHTRGVYRHPFLILAYRLRNSGLQTSRAVSLTCFNAYVHVVNNYTGFNGVCKLLDPLKHHGNCTHRPLSVQIFPHTEHLYASCRSHN
jgi:hypothetical protein